MRSLALPLVLLFLSGTAFAADQKGTPNGSKSNNSDKKDAKAPARPSSSSTNTSQGIGWNKIGIQSIPTMSPKSWARVSQLPSFDEPQPFIFQPIPLIPLTPVLPTYSHAQFGYHSYYQTQYPAYPLYPAGIGDPGLFLRLNALANGQGAFGNYLDANGINPNQPLLK